jgi:hypothetical protein
MPAYCFYLYILQPDSDVGDIMENPGNLSLAPIPRAEHFVQDLKPGMWNHVLFEFPQLKLEKVTSFRITQSGRRRYRHL